MTSFESLARVTAAQLDAVDAAYALIGGFAVSVRCEPRFTRDIDLAVAASTDEHAVAITQALVASGYEVLATVEQERVNRMAAVRLTLNAGEDVVDLLFASSGIEPEIAAAAERIEVLPELELPVARVGHLIALKLLATDAGQPAAMGQWSPCARASTAAVTSSSERSFSR